MATKKKPASAGGDKSSPKQKSVLDIFKAVEKNHGVHHIDLQQATAEDFLSTGCFSLNLILGGGYFGGRVLQYFGPPGAGKSSIAYTSAGELHASNVLTAIFDHEGGLDRAYASRLGVSYDNKNPLLRYFKPTHGPEAYRLMQDVLMALPDKHSGAPQAAFIIDSIAQMPTQQEIEDPTNKSNGMPARRAAMHSIYMGRLRTLISKKHVAVVAINQFRKGMSQWQPETRPGGQAWEFATDNLVKVRKGKSIEVNGVHYQPMIFKTLKNRNFNPLQECQVALRLGMGIDPASDVIEFLKLTGLFRKIGKGKDAKFVIEGLDTYATPEFKKLGKGHLDGIWSVAGLAELEETIREQTDTNKPYYTGAVRALLASGEATKMYLAERKKAPPKEKAKKGESTDEVGAEDFSAEIEDDDNEPAEGAPEGEGAPADEAPAAEEQSEAADEKPVAKLGKKRKKSA